MEFTDVNEKVNELRSKNYKLSSDMLTREDEIDELRRQLADARGEAEKRERLVDELRAKVDAYVDKLTKQENERNEQHVQPERDLQLIDEATEQLRQQLNTLQTQLTAQDDAHTQAIQATKEKLQNMLGEQKQAFESQISALTASKEHELALVQSELAKQTQECDKLAAALARVQLEKHALEQEVNALGEQRAQMGKYDWQMNEILAMLADEKQVRGHLRALAGKLIEEVDSLKIQTSATNHLGQHNSNSNSNNINNNVGGVLSSSVGLNGGGMTNLNGQSILAASLNGTSSNVSKYFFLFFFGSFGVC